MIFRQTFLRKKDAEKLAEKARKDGKKPRIKTLRNTSGKLVHQVWY